MSVMMSWAFDKSIPVMRLKGVSLFLGSFYDTLLLHVAVHIIETCTSILAWF
jgi:hypothetical protein